MPSVIYTLGIILINSLFLNKLQRYSRLDLTGTYTSKFFRNLKTKLLFHEHCMMFYIIVSSFANPVISL